jgi:hypothetical protein
MGTPPISCHRGDRAEAPQPRALVSLFCVPTLKSTPSTNIHHGQPIGWRDPDTARKHQEQVEEWHHNMRRVEKNTKPKPYFYYGYEPYNYYL